MQDVTATEERESFPVSKSRIAWILLLCWFSILGFDLFQHAGIFAGLWLESQSAFLPPEELWNRIPLGYLSFLLSAFLLAWLMLRLHITGAYAGARFGLKIGGLLSMGMVLGIASGFPVHTELLIAWLIGGIAQHALAGAVIGTGFGQYPLRRLTALVFAFVVLMSVTVLAMQNLGLAPAMIHGR